MASGRENVGAAINDPCSRLISSFSIKAERWTISRQRPLYFDFAIHFFQKREVCRKRCPRRSISGCCPAGRGAPNTKDALSPAFNLKVEMTSCECCSSVTVEYRASGVEMSSTGKNIAQESVISARCDDFA